jgi:uncharacterized repeat protein (TIGR01451 family)
MAGASRPDRQRVGSFAPASVQGFQTTPPIQLRSGAFIPLGQVASNLAYARALTVVPGRVRVLLEFAELPGELMRERLQVMGVQLLGPLSGTTWLASLPERLTGSDLESVGVRWVGAVYQEDKVPPRILESGVGEWAWHEDGTVDLRVRYYEDVAPEPAIERLAELDGILLGRSDPMSEFTINLAAERLIRLLSEDWVRWVEEVPPPRIPFNDSSRANVRANDVQAAPYGLTGAGVALGIWDTGDVETGHEDFAGRLILGQSRGNAEVHATHVAGTMAGSGARSEALGGKVSQWRGMAPGATVISYDYEGSVEEHEQAIQQYAVVNSQNSWGFLIARFLMNCDLYGDYSQLAPDYDAIVTGMYGRPITVVFAAGNNRTGLNPNDCSAGPYQTIGPPGTAKNVLTVGAIDSEDNSLAFFSSWGPMSDGRLKPELVAPGSQRTMDMGVTSTVPGNRYGTLQGTSMAAPVVSGAIGLLVEDYRARYNGSDPFPCTVRALLIHTAEDLSDDHGYLHPGPDYASGYGRLQVQPLIDQLRQEAFQVGMVTHGSTNQHELEVPPGTESVKVTLVWDDPRGLENAALALVNDLDLVVLDPNGVRHFPWTLDPANPSAPAVRTREDRVNVIEQVWVGESVQAGIWQVNVVGHSVPMGLEQRYTLVYTPVGMLQTPLVRIDEVQIEDAPGFTGNGDDFTDPGETRSMRVVLRHEAGPVLTGVTTRLWTETPGVNILQGESPYPDLGAGETGTNVVDYSYRLDKSVPCSTPIVFAHIWDSGTYRMTNWFTEWVGRVEVTNHMVLEFESMDVPMAIPDRGLISSMIDISPEGRLTGVQVSVRVEHPWHGDLRLDLTHPDGTRVRLVQASGNSGADFGSGTCDQVGQRTVFDDLAAGPILAGGAPFIGRFRPVEALHTLAGKRVEGVWRLEVADMAADDVGTLLCWGLTLGFEEDGFVCDLFNRPPVVVSDQVEVIHNTPRWIRLPALDPDGDPIEFAITDFPRHGSVSELDATGGRVFYTPLGGHIGADSFMFVARDGYATSESGTIHLEVLAPIADLRLSVDAGSQSVPLSEPFSSTLRVLNLGPNAAGEVRLTHELPAGLDLLEVESAQGSWTVTDGELRVDLGELEVWTTAEIRVMAQASEPGWYTNRAIVTAAQLDSHPASNEIEWITQVLIDADLQVRMEPVPGLLLVGQEARFTARLINQGPHEARSVQMEASWIGAVELVDVELGEGAWHFEDGKVLAELGTLGVDEERVVEFVVRALADGLLTGQVRVSSLELDPNPEDNHAQAAVSVARVVDLGIEQVGERQLMLGGETRQVWVVRNQGPSVGSGVRVTGVVEAGLELTGLEGSQGEWTNAEGEVSWELGELGAGQEAELVLVLRAAEVGWWTNRATVTGQEIEARSEDNSLEEGIEIIPAADLGVGVVDGLGEVLVVERAWSYELTVTNQGPSVAQGVELALTLGEGMELVDVELASGELRAEPFGIVCELGQLAVGEVMSVHVLLRGMTEGSWTNMARVSGLEADPEEGDNEVEWVSEVRRESDMRVELARMGSGELWVGQEARFTARLINQGPHEARSVQMEASWIGAVELVDVELGEGDWHFEDGKVLAELGTLGVDEERVVEFVVRALADGLLTGQVRVSSLELDPNPEDNHAQAAVSVARVVDLGIEQVGERQLMLGGETRQVWVVRNQGPSVGSGVRVTGVVEAGLELTGLEGSQGEWTNAEGEVSWELGELGAGQEAELVLVLRAAEVGWWTNRATVTGQEIEARSEDNSLEEGIEIIPAADLGVGVVDGLGEVLVVERAWSYELTVTNQGPSVAQGVELALTLGEGMELVDVELASGELRAEPFGIVCELGQLAVGEVMSVHVLLRGMTEGSWTNMARVSGLEADPEEGDNEVEWVSEVRRESDMRVELARMGSGELWVGQEARFTARLINQGPHEARSVQLEASWIGAVELVDVELGEGDWHFEDGKVLAELGTLGVDEERVVEFVVRALADGLLTGQVRVSSLELDPNPEDNHAQAAVSVARVVDLGIEQVGERQLMLGGETRQVWVVRNQGPSVGSGVRVTGVVEAGLELTGLEGSQGEWTNAEGEVSWELGELGAGQEAELVLVLRAAEVGWWTNRATVTGQEIEARSEDNSLEEGIEIIPAADLGVWLDDAAENVLPLGSEHRYVLWIRNQGPSAARHVAVVGSVGAGLELLQVDATEGVGEREEDGRWTWELEELAAGEAIEVGLLTRGDLAGIWEWSAQVTADEADPVLDDNWIEWFTEVRQESDLGLELSVNRSEVLVGGTLIYELWVTNQGPHLAPDVTLDWEWLGKIDLVEVQTSQGQWSHMPSQLQFELGNLAVAAEISVRVVVKPARAGHLDCEVVVASSVPDPDESDNMVAVQVVVLAPADLLVTQTASPNPVMVGESLSYWITVQNRSDYTVPDLQVAVWLPEGTDFVTALTSQGLKTAVAGVLEWDLGAVEAGSNATVTVTLVPRQAGTITNRVTLFSTYAEETNPNLVSELTTLVVEEPPLQIERDGSRIVVSWPALAENYTLFATDSLFEPVLWYPDGNPQVVEGTRITVTVKVTNAARYYRLRRP